MLSLHFLESKVAVRSKARTKKSMTDEREKPTKRPNIPPILEMMRKMSYTGAVVYSSDS